MATPEPNSDLAASRTENEALRRLLELVPGLLAQPGLPELTRAAVEAAVALSNATSGDLHLYDVASGGLQLVAQHGFRPASLDQFEWARRATSDVCQQALQSGQCVIVSDVLRSELFRESPEGLALLAAGVRALQITPLICQRGQALGVLTTAWSTPQGALPSTQRVLALLGRQVAELVQQRRAAQELEQTQLACRDANRRAEAFVTMLGYELREPLFPVLTSLQIMDLRGGESFRAERQVIGRQVQHLVRLVDDLQDAARVALGRIELAREPRQLAGLLEQAREGVAPALVQRGQQLSFSFEPELIVHADEARLIQVFQNLLLLSARHAPADARIQVRAERVGDRVQVGVCAPGQAPPVLEPGFDKPGIAVGIVQSLVALHGGSVEVRSGLESGHEIVVSLPASQASVGDSKLVGESPQQCQKPGTRRVLIVEDNPDAAQSLANALALLGYSVEVAPDGPSALDKLRGFSPEIALVDLGLPTMGGYELAKRIRAQGHSAIRLLAVTGFGQLHDRRRSAEVGFEAHLVKPVDIGALEGAIEGTLVAS